MCYQLYLGVLVSATLAVSLYLEIGLISVLLATRGKQSKQNLQTFNIYQPGGTYRQGYPEEQWSDRGEDKRWIKGWIVAGMVARILKP